jgi:hypothetical protein
MSALERSGVAKYVKDENALNDMWRTAAVPSRTFSNVTGVIVVNIIDGFAFIPKEDIDKQMYFDSITQGAPKYELARSSKLITPNSTKKGAQGKKVGTEPAAGQKP